jgi:hypothetical protein
MVKNLLDWIAELETHQIRQKIITNGIAQYNPVLHRLTYMNTSLPCRACCRCGDAPPPHNGLTIIVSLSDKTRQQNQAAQAKKQLMDIRETVLAQSSASWASYLAVALSGFRDEYHNGITAILAG